MHLPHDAMLASGRDPEGDASLAYYRAGAHEYEKSFDVPVEWSDRSVVLRFEGVYRDAVVFLNGEFATHRPYGYSEFAVRLDDFLRYGEKNTIRVECRTGQDSRWYSGAGIYRDVTLFVAEPVHVALDGLRVTTPRIEDQRADVVVAAVIENIGARRRTVEVVTHILDPSGTVVASDRQPLTVAGDATATVHARTSVRGPMLWSVDTPHLYGCRVHVLQDGASGDEATTQFGIRSVTADPDSGLRINGKALKLRGACIHHDSGVLGAATFASAEERRVRVLKAAGFNAIRSAHQPIGRAALDACDRLGMLVMDEAFDMWRDAKRDHDYAMHFPTWWERDLDAIVAKDFNHPSVIFYSIGNEIEEVGVPAGAELARAMAARIRAQDATRLITNGVNLTLTVLADASDGLLNATLGGSGAADLAQSDLVTRKTEESFAVLDVAGYNYAESRYVADHDRFPNRVIVGTETFPRQIDRLWRLVLDNDHVIGDFTWTGWDYLGEVGIGRTEYESDPPVVGDGFVAPYPWRTAACADIDITGHRLPISFYRQIVFGLRVEPFIAVRPPSHHMANKRFSTPWSWSTSVDSWTWDGDEGRPTLVEVYADADEVELIQDGRSLGRQPAGEAHRFSARFEVTYEPGELVAVAHRGGVEVGRTTLRSAVGALRLRLEVDQEEAAHGVADLAFVKVTLVDDAGTPHPGADRDLRVRVEGPAVLQGLGSAAPASEDDYLADHCRTYRGRALAVVRPTGVGAITVHVDSDGIQPAAATIIAAGVAVEGA